MIVQTTSPLQPTETPGSWRLDCYATTSRGYMPARFIGMDGEFCLLQAKNGREYSFHGDRILTVEEAEAAFRQNRVKDVVNNYTFTILSSSPRALRCQNPAHPRRSNYILLETACGWVCSCPSAAKNALGHFGEPCKHLLARDLLEQMTETPAATPSPSPILSPAEAAGRVVAAEAASYGVKVAGGYRVGDEW